MKLKGFILFVSHCGLHVYVFSIYCSGTLEIVLNSGFCSNEGTSNNLVLDTRTSGQYFGELSLIWDRPQSATMHCKDNVKLWRLKREDFFKFNLSNHLIRELFEGMAFISG